MKQLFDASVQDEVRARLAKLQPGSERQWGSMTPAQALAHCAAGLRMALGEIRPPRVFIGRVLGWAIKPLALGNDAPMRRNSPTVPAIEVTDARDFIVERENLSEAMDRMRDAGLAGCTTFPHPFFGRLTPQEWGVLMYKHLDHHLRQFGV